MSKTARKAQKNAGVATAERKPTKPSAADYVTLKIADLDLKGVGNVRDVNQEGLVELVASVKAEGILEPVLVRERDHRWELVAGFRRVAAAKKAGLEHVPARILELDDAAAKEVQLTENLQRADLTPLEEGAGMKAYLEAHPDVTQEQLGKRLGKSQPYVANRIRLLALPESIIKAVDAEKIPASHAEVFLQLPKEATPSEVSDLLSRDVRDGQSTAQLAQAVRWKAETVNRRTRAKKARAHAKESAKFPDCPVAKCGTPGRVDIGYNSEILGFYCVNGHRWNQETGVVTKESSRRQDEEGARMRKPPEPKLPIVPEEVPFETTPQDLVEFLTSVDWKVEMVSVIPDGKAVGFRIEGRSSRAIPRGIPSFALGGRLGPGKAHVNSFYLYGQDTDAARRRCAAQRDELVKWASKLRVDPARSGETKKSPRSKKTETPADAPPPPAAAEPAGSAAPSEMEAPPA